MESQTAAAEPATEAEPEKLPAPAPKRKGGKAAKSTALTITPMQMLQIAVEQNADLEKLSKLMDLQERWEATEARKAFVTAMAAFKKNPPEIVKDTQVKFGQTEYYHATLDQVCAVVGAGLADHGLAYNWEMSQGDGGIITVTCVLTHEHGHSERVSLSAGPDASGGKNGIQQIASTVTYLERYTLMAATGVAAAGRDNDGAGTGDGSVPAERPTRDQYKGPPPETDLGEPFELLDEYGESIGTFDDANACLDAAGKYLGKDLSSAAGAAEMFHEHNQETLDRVTEVIGNSRDNPKVASFFRLLNGKRGD